MALSLSSVAQQLFASEVKQAYQAMSSSLRGTCRVRSGVVGDIYKFRKMGKGLATERTAPQTDVVPMDIQHSLVDCTLSNWDSSEYTDIFQAAEVNFDERRELAQCIGGALNRRLDQLILDAVAAATPAATIAVGTTNLTIDKMAEAAKVLNANEVPSNDRCLVVHADQIEALLGVTEVTSSDYNTVKALVRGEVNTFLGFQFIVLGDRSEGGLEKTGNNRSCFAYHKSAMGLCTGIDLTTEVNYVPQKKSWLASGHFRAGAVAIEGGTAGGIVEIVCDETA